MRVSAALALLALYAACGTAGAAPPTCDKTEEPFDVSETSTQLFLDIAGACAQTSALGSWGDARCRFASRESVLQR